MKSTIEKLPKSRIKLTITLDEKESEKYFDAAYKKLAPSVEIKGFRKGQAPKLLTLETIGHGRYNQEALDLALTDSYYEAVQKEHVVPIQPPSVSVKKFTEKEPLEYVAEVDIVPEIKLGDYKTIKVKYEKKEHKVEESEVNKVLEKLRYQKAIFNNIERGAENGDRIEINFEGTVDKVKQENLTNTNYPLILGEGILIPGFEKELVGMKKNEEKEFDLDIAEPKDKTKTKKAHFKVKITDLKETVLPEINEEFSKNYGHDNPESLKTAIEKSILEEKKKVDKDKLEGEVLKKVVEMSNIDLPESLVEQETSRRLLEMQNQMGPGFYKYLESIGKKIEDIKKDMRVVSEGSVKTGLILGEIARKEGFFTEHKHEHTHDESHDHSHEHENQEQIIRKTVDFLVSSAIK